MNHCNSYRKLKYTRGGRHKDEIVSHKLAELHVEVVGALVERFRRFSIDHIGNLSG